VGRYRVWNRTKYGRSFAGRRWERCKLVVESSVQLGEWEQRPPDDPSSFGRLTGQALAALAQPC